MDHTSTPLYPAAHLHFAARLTIRASLLAQVQLPNSSVQGQSHSLLRSQGHAWAPLHYGLRRVTFLTDHLT